MKCVTYNIQYGIGMDGAYDIERIAGAVRGADLIALQEVSRNNPQNGGKDVVAELTALMPEYFVVTGMPYRMDLGSHIENGKAISSYFEFGNMVLSKTPILSSRNLLLPRSRTYGILNLQRGALEAMVETPAGLTRFYSVHLDHVSPRERISQIEWLKGKVRNYAVEGGAATGLEPLGFPEPPHPENAMLMGDFNMEPEKAEYLAMCGIPDRTFGRQTNAMDMIDVSVVQDADGTVTPSWFDPKGELPPARLDFCFASGSLAAHCGKARIDSADRGSDHRPVWIEID